VAGGADGNVIRIHFTRDINTGFTSLGVYWPGGGNTQRTGIVPDSVVIPTAKDIRDRRDPALEKALRIAGCPVAGIQADPSVTSPGFALEQNFPNPFTTATGIAYTLSGTERVLLTVHAAFGRLVATLVDAEMTAGTRTAELTAASLPAGAYLCRLQAGRRITVRKVTRVR